ncbi:DUF2796 domain-containing protein [Gynuella sp.]|uniref:DUF2796 domain-containing protein n=1 Tax=Gynuella sp. TaxID=2969146 RepID=UPI003D130F1B
MKKILILTAALGSSVCALAADEHRQHGAHEHGAAKLMLAQDGKDFQISLDTPAFNIYGFEHKPDNAQEKELVDNANALLKQGEELFLFPKDAQCSLQEASVETEQHEHGDEADEHEHEHGDEADEDEHEHGGHSDLNVAWHFSCAQPLEAKTLTLTLFDAFDNLKDLDVEYLTDSGQGAVELSPKKHTFKF